ncbi:MAG: isoprenylcysteine carboxylmethyltransferase family protein [Rhodospirillales bacterium]|nr:isoprenylcysteine carboxylmethyltransferase family protein [Rhodospirillales bacterium]
MPDLHRQNTANKTVSTLQVQSDSQAAALQTVQRRRKTALRVGGVGLLGLVCFSQAGFDPSNRAHDMIEALGIIAILMCIVGRGWCSLYIGGRKKTALVTTGPYSISRNPLYVFSFIGAFGAGAQTGSVMIAMLFMLGCWLVFRTVVVHEEEMLGQRFGVAFADYCQSVPRFWPVLAKWRDERDLTVRPELYLTTIRDACWFLMAVPVFEGIKLLQNQGWLMPLIWLP